MATKADFTAEEWDVLEYAVVDAMTYTAYADPGFWASFKEASASAKFLAQQRDSSPSLLVRDLAAGVHAKPDKQLQENRADVAGEASARIEQAAGIVSEKAPEELEAFKTFVLGLADVAAEASGAISDSERKALDRIKAALG
jgi:hypothetical protein